MQRYVLAGCPASIDHQTTTKTRLMKQFILSAIASLLLFSCNKNNDTPNSQDKGIRVISYSSPGVETRFTYDSQHRLTNTTCVTEGPPLGPFTTPTKVVTTTEFEYEFGKPVKSKSRYVTTGVGPIELFSSASLKWSIGGNLLESTSDNNSRVIWHSDGNGRVTGFTPENGRRTEWNYDNKGNVLINIPADGQGGYSSEITYSSYENPFYNGRSGLLAYFAGQRATDDPVRFFSAHLPEKWESHYKNKYGTNPVTEINHSSFISYSYGFNSSGLLNSITETRKNQTFYNGQLTNNTETVITYAITCYKIN